MAINTLIGENGIVSKAQIAKSETENKQKEEEEKLNQIENLMNNNKAEVDISKLNSIWLGDSIFEGFGNNNKGYAEYFSDMAKPNFIYNGSIGGTTLSNNTPDRGGVIQTILGELKDLENIKEDYENSNELKYSDMNLVVLDGGGNDVITYIDNVDEAYKKEIGTFEDTSSNTVMNDYREIVAKIKELFPNAKILYTNINPISERALLEFEFSLTGGVEEFGNRTIEEINEDYSVNCANLYEAKKLWVEIKKNEDTEINRKFSDMENRAKQLIEQLPKVSKDLGVEYINLIDVIEQNRDLKSNLNSYIQDDKIHTTHEGYMAITPLIIDKIKEMFRI